MLQIQDFKSLADNATQRAEEAEHYQKMVQVKEKIIIYRILY